MQTADGKDHAGGITEVPGSVEMGLCFYAGFQLRTLPPPGLTSVGRI